MGWMLKNLGNGFILLQTGTVEVKDSEVKILPPIFRKNGLLLFQVTDIHRVKVISFCKLNGSYLNT